MFDLKDFSYFYNEDLSPVLEDISLKIEEGEFVGISGESGSGKTTLIRVLSSLIPHFYGGVLKGRAKIFSRSIIDLKDINIASKIGVMFQDPRTQIIFDNVKREIVFPLENLGISNTEIKRRLVEVVSFLGISNLLQRKTLELSFGELQKVILASILITKPKALILDEPTSELSESSSFRVFSLLKRLNEDNAITVIIVEQNLEKLLSIVDRVVEVERGKIVFDSNPRDYIKYRKEIYPISFLDRAFSLIDKSSSSFTIKEKRAQVKELIKNKKLERIKKEKGRIREKTSLLEIKDLSFCYKKTKIPFLKNFSLKVNKGEIVTLLGENGAGKSTILKLISGALKPLRGEIFIEGEKINRDSIKKDISLLCDDLNSYFFNNTVKEEITFNREVNKVLKLEKLKKLNIEHLLKKDPRDLSLGEKQRVILSILLEKNQKLLLLDEPSRGLDFRRKEELISLLKEEALKNKTTIIIATQDIDFCSEVSDSLVILDNGSILEEGKKEKLLDNKIFYSSSINKVFSGYFKGVVSLSDVRELEVKREYE